MDELDFSSITELFSRANGVRTADPMNEIASLLVAAPCILVGVLFAQLIGKPSERATLTKLFLAAFLVRCAFTMVFYAIGLADILGGADDTIWKGMWTRSRYWETSGPASITEIYDIGSRNPGFMYFGSLFYYLLNARSQMALAFLNGFFNALTVMVIYKAAREFFDERASSFAAWVAVLLPSFLVWSALTVKESWLIFLEISVFYILFKAAGSRRDPFRAALCVLMAVALIALTYTLRFYAAWFLLAGTIVTLMCNRSKRPTQAAAISFGVVVMMFLGANLLNLVPMDLASMTEARLGEMAEFRADISDADKTGTGSAVNFDFDTTTPGGALLMLVVGGIYVLLSPFPWDVFRGRMIFSLPDVLMWWWLVFVYMLPGLRAVWGRHKALLMSVAGFVLPLFLFYSFLFGNIGLAYRQRAQLMPFLLILVAAGHHYKRHRVEKTDEAPADETPQSESPPIEAPGRRLAAPAGLAAQPRYNGPIFESRPRRRWNR